MNILSTLAMGPVFIACGVVLGPILCGLALSVLSFSQYAYQREVLKGDNGNTAIAVGYSQILMCTVVFTTLLIISPLLGPFAPIIPGLFVGFIVITILAALCAGGYKKLNDDWGKSGVKVLQGIIKVIDFTLRFIPTPIKNLLSNGLSNLHKWLSTFYFVAQIILLVGISAFIAPGLGVAGLVYLGLEYLRIENLLHPKISRALERFRFWMGLCSGVFLPNAALQMYTYYKMTSAFILKFAPPFYAKIFGKGVELIQKPKDAAREKFSNMPREKISFEQFKKLHEQISEVNKLFKSHHKDGVGGDLKRLHKELDGFSEKYERFTFVRKSQRDFESLWSTPGLRGKIAYCLGYIPMKIINIGSFIYYPVVLNDFLKNKIDNEKLKVTVEHMLDGKFPPPKAPKINFEDFFNSVSNSCRSNNKDFLSVVKAAVSDLPSFSVKEFADNIKELDNEDKILFRLNQELMGKPSGVDPAYITAKTLRPYDNKHALEIYKALKNKIEKLKPIYESMQNILVEKENDDEGDDIRLLNTISLMALIKYLSDDVLAELSLSYEIPMLNELFDKLLNTEDAIVSNNLSINELTRAIKDAKYICSINTFGDDEILRNKKLILNDYAVNEIKDVSYVSKIFASIAKKIKTIMGNNKRTYAPEIIANAESNRYLLKVMSEMSDSGKVLNMESLLEEVGLRQNECKDSLDKCKTNSLEALAKQLNALSTSLNMKDVSLTENGEIPDEVYINFFNKTLREICYKIETLKDVAWDKGSDGMKAWQIKSMHVINYVQELINNEKIGEAQERLINIVVDINDHCAHALYTVIDDLYKEYVEPEYIANDPKISLENIIGANMRSYRNSSLNFLYNYLSNIDSVKAALFFIDFVDRHDKSKIFEGLRNFHLNSDGDGIAGDLSNENSDLLKEITAQFVSYLISSSLIVCEQGYSVDGIIHQLWVQVDSPSDSLCPKQYNARVCIERWSKDFQNEDIENYIKQIVDSKDEVQVKKLLSLMLMSTGVFELNSKEHQEEFDKILKSDIDENDVKHKLAPVNDLEISNDPLIWSCKSVDGNKEQKFVADNNTAEIAVQEKNTWAYRMM